MTTKLPASFLPAKFQVLSGSALKLIAITLMLIDHTGLMILYNYPATTATLFSFGGVDYSWYRILAFNTTESLLDLYVKNAPNGAKTAVLVHIPIQTTHCPSRAILYPVLLMM